MTATIGVPGDPRPRLVLWALVPATPATALRPNAKAHHLRRADAARALRTAAKLAAVDALNAPGCALVPCPPDGPLWLRLRVVWERGRQRQDFDGCLSSLKSAIDGVFDAIGADDARIAGVALRQEVAGDRQGRVDVSVWTGEAPWDDGDGAILRETEDAT